MEARELQIGDWVQNPLGWKARVMSIKHTCVIKDEWEYLFKIGISKDTFQNNLSESDLSPIPLTQEILEKNGFEYYDSFATLDTEKYRVIYAFDGFLTIVDNDNQRKVSYLECDYVHHLQHTLRLCRIEKEIEL